MVFCSLLHQNLPKPSLFWGVYFQLTYNQIYPYILSSHIHFRLTSSDYQPPVHKAPFGILDFYFGVMMEMILNFCDTHFFYDENDENMMFLRNLLTTINVTNFTTTADTHSFYTLHTVIYTPTQKLHATLTLCTSNRVCEKITTFYPCDFWMASLLVILIC